MPISYSVFNYFSHGSQGFGVGGTFFNHSLMVQIRHLKLAVIKAASVVTIDPVFLLEQIK